MERIAILGLGLMGGSLAMALRERSPGTRIQAYARREETRRAAFDLGLADAIDDRPEAAVRKADLVVVCVPVGQIPGVIRACHPGLLPGAVVTDVGSTKAWVQAEACRAIKGSTAGFVGSHPIAGSERQGLDAARADLYDGAVTVVCQGAADTAARDRVAELWRTAGSRVLFIEAEAHDRALARTSHVPHLAAAMLAATVGRGAEPGQWREFCGSGFRDSTRIAEGGPEIWAEIVRTNRAAILEELDALSERIHALTDAIRSRSEEQVLRLLEEGQRARRCLLGEGQAGEGNHEAG